MGELEGVWFSGVFQKEELPQLLPGKEGERKGMEGGGLTALTPTLSRRERE